jgi:hypothetical protein
MTPKIIMGFTFLVAISAAFAFKTKAEKDWNTATKFEQTDATHCISRQCSDTAPSPVAFCYTTSLSNLKQSQVSGSQCGTADETVFKYKVTD